MATSWIGQYAFGLSLTRDAKNQADFFNRGICTRTKRKQFKLPNLIIYYSDMSSP